MKESLTFSLCKQNTTSHNPIKEYAVIYWLCEYYLRPLMFLLCDTLPLWNNRSKWRLTGRGSGDGPCIVYEFYKQLSNSTSVTESLRRNPPLLLRILPLTLCPFLLQPRLPSPLCSFHEGRVHRYVSHGLHQCLRRTSSGVKWSHTSCRERSTRLETRETEVKSQVTCPEYLNFCHWNSSFVRRRDTLGRRPSWSVSTSTNCPTDVCVRVCSGLATSFTSCWWCCCCPSSFWEGLSLSEYPF